MALILVTCLSSLENVYIEVPQKTEKRTTLFSSNSTLSKENRNTKPERYMQLNIHNTFIYNS